MNNILYRTNMDTKSAHELESNTTEESNATLSLDIVAERRKAKALKVIKHYPIYNIIFLYMSLTLIL